MAKQALSCGTVSYFQSYPDFCKNVPRAGIEATYGGSSPASSKSTLTEGSSDNLDAITLPDEPPPTEI